MNTPPPEKRRVKVSSGTLPAPKIASLAASHPFSQQLDVVFPSDPVLLEALQSLETGYVKAKVRLVDVVNNADVFATSENESNPLIICTNPSEVEDAWCIDPRAYLTLAVSTSSYERLGLVGQKLPFKNQKDRHVIAIPLRKNAQSSINQAKQRKSLEDWDARRESEFGKDAGLWSVLYCSNEDIGSSRIPFQESGHRRVQCKSREFKDLNVPTPSLQSRPESSSKQKSKSELTEEEEEQLEDWNSRVQSLFEWVGMACLGAQRLRANDRVDPYVAVYEPPQPSNMQNVTHLQWCGLLSPAFVKQVIDTILSTLQNPTSSSCPFIGITCQALSSSPVSYIPYTTSATGVLQSPTTVPPKLPRKDGEDCWSLIVECPAEGNVATDKGVQKLNWCLAESLGQWDARWG